MRVKLFYEAASDLRPELTCPMCMKEFQCRRNRDRHFDAVHLKLKNFKCPLCEIRYAQKVHLKGHMQRLHNFNISEGSEVPIPLRNVQIVETETNDDEKKTNQYN